MSRASFNTTPSSSESTADFEVDAGTRTDAANAAARRARHDRLPRLFHAGARGARIRQAPTNVRRRVICSCSPKATRRESSSRRLISRPADRRCMRWPKDPNTSVVRSASRLNEILIIRLDPAELDEKTRARAVDGIVAYSAICSHAGCPVTAWVKSESATRTCSSACATTPNTIPRGRAGRVRTGAAAARRAAAGASADGALSVAGGFIGKVGGAAAGDDGAGRARVTRGRIRRGGRRDNDKNSKQEFKRMKREVTSMTITSRKQWLLSELRRLHVPRLDRRHRRPDRELQSGHPAAARKSGARQLDALSADL